MSPTPHHVGAEDGVTSFDLREFPVSEFCELGWIFFSVQEKPQKAPEQLFNTLLWDSHHMEDALSFGHPQVAQRIIGGLQKSRVLCGCGLWGHIVTVWDDTDISLRCNKATPTAGHKTIERGLPYQPWPPPAVFGHRPTFSAKKVPWLTNTGVWEGFCRKTRKVPLQGSEWKLGGGEGGVRDWFLWAVAQSNCATHSSSCSPGAYSSLRGLEKVESSAEEILSQMKWFWTLTKSSFPWKRFCFFKSKTKPLRLQKNTTQRLRQFGELACSFPPLPFCPLAGPGGTQQGLTENAWGMTSLTPRQSLENPVTLEGQEIAFPSGRQKEENRKCDAFIQCHHPKSFFNLSAFQAREMWRRRQLSPCLQVGRSIHSMNNSQLSFEHLKFNISH